MSKDQFTPRDELICGKLDTAILLARGIQDVELIFLLDRIRNDAERMEAGLVRRKDQLAAAQARIAELEVLCDERALIIVQMFGFHSRDDEVKSLKAHNAMLLKALDESAFNTRASYKVIHNGSADNALNDPYIVDRLEQAIASAHNFKIKE